MPTKKVHKPAIIKPSQPVIIYKTDTDLIEETIKREINEHEQGTGGWH